MTTTHLPVEVDEEGESQLLLDESEEVALTRCRRGRYTVAAFLGVFVLACAAATFAQTRKHEHATSPGLASAAVGFEEAYHYDVEILSGDLEEKDIRDIYDVLFEVKPVD